MRKFSHVQPLIFLQMWIWCPGLLLYWFSHPPPFGRVHVLYIYIDLGQYRLESNQSMLICYLHWISPRPKYSNTFGKSLALTTWQDYICTFVILLNVTCIDRCSTRNFHLFIWIVNFVRNVLAFASGKAQSNILLLSHCKTLSLSLSLKSHYNLK